MSRTVQTTEYDAQRYMLIVIMALAPCFMMGVYVFGLDMLDNMIGGCALAVLLDWLVGRVAGKYVFTAHDRDRDAEHLAAIVTGALIVYGTPSTIPIWIVFTGVAIAMIPVRILMDQIWKKHPGDEKSYLLKRAVLTAVTARCAVWVLFREEMNTWPLNDFVETRVSPGEIATGMTPLGILAEEGDLPGLSRMIIGFISGPCGEVSVAAALIGGCYLIWKKIISPLIPVCVIGTIFITMFIYYAAAVPTEVLDEMIGSEASGMSSALYMAFFHVLAGGAVFGAFLMAPALFTGYEPGRKTRALQILFGIGVSLITAVIRIYMKDIESLAIPVLIMYTVILIISQIPLKKDSK